MQKSKIQLNYGTIAGLVGFVFFLIYYIFDADPFGLISWVSFWVPALFMYLGTKNFRDKLANGYISYWQAFFSCLLIAMVQASLVNMLVYLFGIVVDHSFVQLHINETLAYYDKYASRIPKDKMKQIVDKIKGITLSKLVIGDFVNKVVGGIIVALILAGVLKKNRDLMAETFEEAEIAENTAETNE